MKSAQQMATNWSNGMASPSASANYKAGIAATQINPMQAAASPEAEALYLANVQAAVASGRRSAKLNAVPMQYWKDQATNIGATNLAAGARKAGAKVSAFFGRWAPIYAQASAAARALPKGGINNAMARVQASLSVMMAAKGT